MTRGKGISISTADLILLAAIIEAEGEAGALRLISEALSRNPDLLTYRYVEKLAPNVQVMMLPSGSPFIIDLQQLTSQIQPEAPLQGK